MPHPPDETKSHDQVKVLGWIAQYLAADDDFPTRLSQSLEGTAHVLRATAAYVATVDWVRGRTLPLASSGLSFEAVPLVELEDGSLAAHAIVSRDICIWPGATQGAVHPSLVGATTYATEIIAPLEVDGTVLGVLSYAKTQGVFTDDDVAFVQSVAAIVGVMMEYTTSTAASQRVTTIPIDGLNSADVRAVLLRAACDLVGTDVGALWQLPAPEGLPERVASRGMHTLEGEAIDSEARRVECYRAGTSGRFNGHSGDDEPLDHWGPEISELPTPWQIGSTRVSLALTLLVPARADPMILTLYAPREQVFLRRRVRLLRHLLRRGADALDASLMYGRVVSLNREIVENAQLANPGLVALSFVHDASHAMQNINGLLSSLIYLLPEKARESPPGKDVIARLGQQTKHLADLFRSLVNLRHGEKGKWRNTRIREIAEDVVPIFALRAGRTNLRITESGDAYAYVNPREIAQVLLNLLNNAIEAIELSPNRRRGVVTIHVEAGVRAAVVEVSDNGIGLPAHDLPRLFEPSFTTKGEPGRGFGLAICRRIVEDSHGGRIDVQSAFGRGTTFRIELPTQASR